MPRLKCLSALASIKCQIAIFELTNRHHPRRPFAPGTIGTIRWQSLIYDSPSRRKCGLRLELAPLRNGGRHRVRPTIPCKGLPVNVEPGAVVVKGPYVAETIAVSVESDYVVVAL
jgi:hypothetical protein